MSSPIPPSVSTSSITSGANTPSSSASGLCVSRTDVRAVIPPPSTADCHDDFDHSPLPQEKHLRGRYIDSRDDCLSNKDETRYPTRTTSQFMPDFRAWTTGDPSQYPIPGNDNPWDECFKMVLKFDEEMCRGWREEVDTLLVFAGLFSAAVTAFTIESYQWLQQDPQTIQVQLLQTIVEQLGNGGSNGTATKFPSTATFSPSRSSVRVNIFWFTSLTLSLSAVLIGILCKQWLREYQRYEGLSSKDAFPVRQLRYEGLIAWQVPTILSSLPLVLQAALVLFFAGLIDLLWTINSMVGSVISIVVGVVMICLIATTILPCFQNLSHISTLWSSHDREPSAQCAFKSPQSWAFHLLVTSLVSLYSSTKQRLFYGTAVNYLQFQLNFWHSEDANWVKYDQRWQANGKYVQRGINWFDRTFARGKQNMHAIYNIYHCLESLEANVSAACVSNIIEENWNPLVPLVGLIQPTLKSFQDPALPYGVTSDFARHMILTSYLVVHRKSNTNLTLHCMERCIKMLNCLPSSQSLGAVVLEILNIVVPVPGAPEEFGTQLTGALSGALNSNTISESDLPAFWSIVHHLVRKHEDIDVPLHGLFLEMESWLGSKMSSTSIAIAEKQLTLRHCAIGVLSMCSLLRLPRSFSQTFLSHDGAPPSLRDVESSKDVEALGYLQSLIALMNCSMDMLLGGPAVIMSMWEADNWKLLTQELEGIVNPATDNFIP